MSGSQGSWRIEYSSYFEKYLHTCLRENYKKDRKGKEEFLRKLDELVDKLADNPLLGKLEPFPDIEVPQGYELRKYYFTPPRLKGASAEGRLIYLLDRQRKVLILVHVYTHKQYEDRPDIDFIDKLIRESQRE